jgi:magnesium-transporting ATPase (P-type)
VKTVYEWVGINSFHIPRKLFSIVVSVDVTTKGEHILYCKGRPEDIIERLRLSKETQKII